ncbi:MAG: DUF2167 domain-containing protein [Flavipsychrobacter sp.]|jgi:uncharacterized membrane-anchored protein|nr:DUF2167 domain-containing protein [Flavipsychrobacter sp.]
MTKILLAGSALIASLSAYSAPIDSVQLAPTEPNQIQAIFKKQADSLNQVLKFHSGKLRFTDQSIRMKVPDGYYFIEPDQARYILENIWGNIPDEEVLGMIVRSDFAPSNINSDYSFVISYAPIGYVSTETDKEFNHLDLLNDIRDQLQKANEKRLELGFNSLQVENWVMVPYFDEYKKALYWATELKVNGSNESLVNYNLRLLGKNGVLKINAVGTMDQLPAIKKVLPFFLSQSEFLEGFRYSDHAEQSSSNNNWKLSELISGKQQKSTLFDIPKPIAAGSLLMIGTFFFIRRFSNSKRKPVKATA